MADASTPPGAAPGFELARRAPPPHLRGIVAALSGYREAAAAPFCQREAAGLVVPLVISFGTPFLIGLGRDPGIGDRHGSFAAGLYPGPVVIRSDGRAACMQVDFTPLGAFTVFGGAVAELASRMVDLGDLLGREGVRLRERLAEAPGWDARFGLVEAFVTARLGRPPSLAVRHAYARLSAAGGAVRVAELAAELGWSRKHLSNRFQAEVGLAPKTVARMMRFAAACRLARSGRGGGWAQVAAEAGYADQAHLSREFAEFAGEAPQAWARRLSTLDPALLRPE